MPKSQVEVSSTGRKRVEIYNSKSKKVFDLPFDLLPVDQEFTLNDCHARQLKVKCLLDKNPADFKSSQIRAQLEGLQKTFSRFGVRSFTKPKPGCEFKKYLVKEGDDAREPDLRLWLASCAECKEKKKKAKRPFF